jgi:hypothetical protein
MPAQANSCTPLVEQSAGSRPARHQICETELEPNGGTRMRKTAFAALSLAAVAVAVPAQAKPGKAHEPTKSHKCKPHAVAYTAKGTLVSGTLTQTKGADTATRRDDRYSGDLTVDVKRASHHGATGSQTYTLDNARARFYDANHDHTADVPKAGDRVKVKGRITRLAKKCDQTGFTPTTTVRRVEFRAAKPKA